MFNSVDELGIYDVSALIDHVLKETGQESIFYVGHSLGTSVLFILLSERPEYNSKIKAVAAMAPAIGGRHCSIFVVKTIISPICTLMVCLKIYHFTKI
jgi:pimeloyl-ACP methyl ester carboxylesterase